MYCPKCNRFTLQIEHISESGKMTKHCHKCLKKSIVSNFFMIDDLEEIGQKLIFPKSYFLLPIDLLANQTLQEFGNDLSDFLLENYGYKFRCFIIFKVYRFDKNIDNHLYAYCSLSNEFQPKDKPKRKRLNYGFERFNCNGSLFIHQSESFISLMIRHEITHQNAQSPVDLELITKIEQMCLQSSPAHIYKELKASEPREKILNLTSKKVIHHN